MSRRCSAKTGAYAGNPFPIHGSSSNPRHDADPEIDRATSEPCRQSNLHPRLIWVAARTPFISICGHLYRRVATHILKLESTLLTAAITPRRLASSKSCLLRTPHGHTTQGLNSLRQHRLMELENGSRARSTRFPGFRAAKNGRASTCSSPPRPI